MKYSVAGIVRIDSLFFVARRLARGQMGGRWEFPGGKVEDGEILEKTLIREFWEEFSIPVTVGSLIAKVRFKHNDKTIQLYAFEVFMPEDEIEWILTEHTEIAWMTLHEIRCLDFVDSDLLLVPKIEKWVNGL